MPPEAPPIEALDVSRTYRGGGHEVRSVDHLSLAVARGEVVAVTGPSGSGKSTLVYLLGGLDVPDEGHVRVTGVDWESLRGGMRARFRRRTCGFIVQGLALLPPATAAENVEVPLLLDGVEATERGRRVAEALERVGLAEHSLKLTDQLSGGQQQRVAIARALVAEPAVVLADEPTGSLDSATAQDIVRLLVATARERDAAVLVVTHDPTVAAHADRVVALHSGRLQAGMPADEARGTGP
ncbi:ABC transporter ATP-binding protein [Mycolicibacterium sp.]|uniref:ABC transporter ATP-binding protein n=1 Tax=Mycolicibacterium sp. TaxID=2320850 RepID=UPI001A19CFF7|nr:ABC transporter ATP-binding protein [Mycolicibacterium sp.]MBJ7341547.1 ABC transporter ATP-binding protein [Mycolicibacterium sp.]